jgi:hypothetical protein
LKPDWGKPAVRNFREEDGNGSYRAILSVAAVFDGPLSKNFDGLPASASRAL